jgi:glycosyltransferase involved in cell wall biosynthesis
MPAFDRDRGSQEIDTSIRYLLEAGWSVTFLAREEEGEAEERHAQRLRNLGVATYAGFGWAERLLRSNHFDLALIAFWDPASALLPLIREHSPDTRVIINSIDVHFLRLARRAFVQSRELDGAFGGDTARELNTYNAADAVITVSDDERALLGDFLGDDRVFSVPLAEHAVRSTVPLAGRRGMLFVANFRHEPNKEAVEYLCREVMPLLDRDLLARHPLTVLGNRLAETTLAIDPEMPGLNLVGWVPTITPYLERSRISVVPLLHGAGVKGKVLQSIMAYTPVVTTPVGAEGLDLEQGVHALIGSDAADLAAGITRLLTDDTVWQRVADAGAAHLDARHNIELVRDRFLGVVERVMARPPRSVTGRRSTASELALAHVAAVRERVQMLALPGAVVLVASGGDPALVALGSLPSRHFPQGADGGWAGFDPVDGRAAINHLEAQRTGGARYFVLPAASFSWQYRFPELHEHLEREYRRLHQDQHLVVYDLADRADDVVLDPTPVARVQVLGTYASNRTGPPAALVAELQASSRLTVDQIWRTDVEAGTPALPATTDADFVVFVRDDAILPSGFLDQLLATQVTLGADRIQPAHTSGPTGGPPITERQRGTVARELDAITPLPVLAVRAGATREGRVVIADEVTIGLRDPIVAADRDVDGFSAVRRVWVRDAHRRPVEYVRPEPAAPPRISALIATYQRADLLRECLTAFAKQTLDAAEYEVVVVDDGSGTSTIDPLLEEFADQLSLTGIRIEHAGRSAAKNMAVLLARAPLVLFFDDDDRPAPDYLERHVLAHDRRPDLGVAILGHTDWAPELDLTPLMHFVTDVDRLMFAYERLGDGQELDWRGFWEGRISCKRALLMRHGLHDQRLNYSIDVEMGWRVAPQGLRVIYDTSAVSVMARPLDLDTFCDRTQAKGKAHAIIAALHPGTDIANAFQLDEAVDYWQRHRASEPELRQQAAALEARSETDESVLAELHAAYRQLFRLLRAKGVAEATGEVGAVDAPAPEVVVRATPPARLERTVPRFDPPDPAFVGDFSPESAAAEPKLTITIPVWSRTPELAAMAQRTIDRIWDVARVPTEIVVIDNGSPHEVPLAAKVYRYPENRGVSIGWNTGIRYATAPVLVVLNSDCRVEPGWDEALFTAATDGRRIAFPYTDHCDGLGFTAPDQAGTAGWCFMMSRAVHDEIGVFDEWFSPAFGEDTDYWHRAWELGIELTPVPAARVVHARRTTGGKDTASESLLQQHRYKYAWKHGVDPHRAPPYYNREIVEYRGSNDARA